MTENANAPDKYYCKCFKIKPNDIEFYRNELLKLGFEDQTIQHGRDDVFGLICMITDKLQIQCKIMRDGVIESGKGPPTELSAADINDKHCHPAHNETKMYLDEIGIPYTVASTIPEFCKNPEKNNDDSTLTWKEYAAMAGVGLAAASFMGLLFKHRKKTKK